MLVVVLLPPRRAGVVAAAGSWGAELQGGEPLHLCAHLGCRWGCDGEVGNRGVLHGCAVCCLFVGGELVSGFGALRPCFGWDISDEHDGAVVGVHSVIVGAGRVGDGEVAACLLCFGWLVVEVVDDSTEQFGGPTRMRAEAGRPPSDMIVVLITSV